MSHCDATAQRSEGLLRHLDWLGILDCLCDHAYKGLGVLHGVSMGKGWVRTSTDPDCPHHGVEAVRQWEIRTYGTTRIKPRAQEVP